MHNVVITGGSAGFGKALGYEFCKRKHNVLLAGRDIEKLKIAKKYITTHTDGMCHILQCDVSNHTDVSQLGVYANNVFESGIDHWINNAGVCDGPNPFTNASFQDIETVVNTNITGIMYCSKIAIDAGAKNIYGISGHGSDGFTTPDFAIYGTTKAALAQLYATLAGECQGKPNVRIIAPGLMRTELSRKLLEDKSMNHMKKILFSLVAAKPETVAKRVVPKILDANGTGITIRGFL